MKMYQCPLQAFSFRQTSEQKILFASAFSVFFLPTLFSALAHRPALYQRWRLVLWGEAGRSLCKPPVSKPLASDAINEAIETRQRMILDVSFIKTKCKLVNVPAKMLSLV
jgi:hypothetical protein